MTNLNPPTPEMALAMRAMLCKNWKPANGVLDLRGARVNLPAGYPDIRQFSVIFCLPDFRDAATVEHLRTLTRKHSGEAAVSKAAALSGLEEASDLLASLEGAP